LDGKISMRLSKRKIEKYGFTQLCKKWERIEYELDLFRKIAKIQIKYYALLPYRPQKEPDLYKTIDIRLSDGIYLD
jgi:hypothetical protein